jgi:hypothetical protein
MKCDEMRELFEAYALGALDQDEADLVERHVGGCYECRRELDAYLSAVAALDFALPSAESPPRGSKDAILSKIAGGRRESRLRSILSRLTLFPRLQLARPAAAFVLLAILLSAGSLVWALHLSSALARERDLRAELSEKIGDQEAIFEVVDSSQTVRAILRSTDGTNAYGKLYTHPELREVVALTGRMSNPRNGQVYNLWLTEDGAEFLAGEMTVNNEGFALILYDAGRVGPEYESARVVLQPAGSIAPQGRVVLQWEGEP